MKSSENKPKVCTKLFPRHNSDSCISPSKLDTSTTDSEESLRSIVASTSDEQPSSSILDSSISPPPITLPVVSKENHLVSEAQKLSVASTSIRTLRINVPLELKIAPFSALQHHQRMGQPKFIKLTNFDMKKLVPISKEDLRIKLPLQPTVQVTSSCATVQKPNIAILAEMPNKKICPGDTFRAVKVGNTFQLVPLERMSDSSKKSN